MLEVLREMRELGFPIKYDRIRGTYYYTEAGEMINGLFFKYGQLLAREKLKEITNADDLCFSPTFKKNT